MTHSVVNVTRESCHENEVGEKKKRFTCIQRCQGKHEKGDDSREAGEEGHPSGENTMQRRSKGHSEIIKFQNP